MKNKITYKDAGVDISKGNRVIDIIRPYIRSTFDKSVLSDIGYFGGLYKLNISSYKEPVLVSSTDGVGTKLKIAFMMNRHDTVGIDLVAMCVNDILTCGARPLFFLDYLSTGKLSIRQVSSIIKGIVEGCRQAGCALIGGETAEMPGFYAKGEYDMAGFAVGIVEKNHIIDGKDIKKGDVLIGLASNGLHSNGYSLVRKVLFEVHKLGLRERPGDLNCTLGEELLKPTRIYTPSVNRLINKFRIKGIAHITGGGLTENLPRLLKSQTNLRFVIEKKSWPVHSIFSLIQKLGNVSEREMFKTFNMGIGLVLVVEESEKDRIIKTLKRYGEMAYIVGRVDSGRRGVIYV